MWSPGKILVLANILLLVVTAVQSREHSSKSMSRSSRLSRVGLKINSLNNHACNFSYIIFLPSFSCLHSLSVYMWPALRKGTINFETFNNCYFSAQYVGCTLQCSVVYM